MSKRSAKPPPMRTARQLIREECANHMGGLCLLRGGPCPQMGSMSLICKYFRDCVLPVDKQLYEWAMSGEAVKTCEDCGARFRAVDAHAKRCRRCAVERRKRYEAE